MGRFIDMDKLVLPKGTVDKIQESGVPAILDWLAEQESIEVVKCKDCKHYGRNWCLNEEMPICGDDATTFEPDEDFWCKYGERKETE